ncbi:M23 family metallopeptidase [Cohnella sp. LGH]|uniref:M23 family metallopeptidase n=1 Tax=Cohnella sp. LGH TaxID=1619153 RepID=UPI0027393618|nr:M23 family metallopeptidase [Cohnella sp. LGH]
MKKWLGLGIALVLVLILGAAWLLYDQRNSPPPNTEPAARALSEGVEPQPSAAQEEAPPVQNIAEFRMLDLDAGWFRYADGSVMLTEDGGVHWQQAGSDWREPVDEDGAGAAEVDGAAEKPADEAEQAIRAIEAAYIAFSPGETVDYKGQRIAVKQAQPVTGQVGWALAAEGSGLVMPLLVTVDGGRTWHDEVTADVRAAMEEEKAKRERRAEEAALYGSPQLALQAMKPGRTLLPDRTYPGDAVLVRSSEPGELEWQEQTYKLQPHKAGYFTYLPIPRALEPGTYEIGDRQLIVEEKEFKTQYLKVSEQMESMRRNTERIQADQEKVKAARENSASTFLFNSEFVAPLKGRLSTPFGYTRYVNGKLSNSHMAIDLAVPEGTPIKAANDGVVALAEDLYLSGNTIYLDHGMGLFSQYAHLSKIQVEVGDTVKKGDIIGLVGSTGFSTGPHLHFTFWAHDVPVNPDLFFETTPFQWLKAPQ